MKRFSVFFLVLSVLLMTAPAAWGQCIPAGTDRLDVLQVNQDGFGDNTNQYAWASAVFKGKLYIATLNAQRAIPGIMFFFLGIPFGSNGGQVWCGDVDGEGVWTWENVLEGGNGDPWHYGIRKMAVVGEYLYAVTGNHVFGFEVWRTFDGKDWEVVSSPGFGNTENTSGRGLGAFQGYLYVGTENRHEGAEIWRREILPDGDFFPLSEWEQVASEGITDPVNFWFSDFVVFGNHLYTGTLKIGGMQLWRTDGLKFEQLFDKGYDNERNMGAMKLTLYQDRLFIGTMNWLQGFEVYASEKTLDHYEQECEEMVFLKVLVDENEEFLRWSPYMWYLQEYMGKLYAGSFRLTGGFKLYTTTDGEDFYLETEDSFGCPAQYGVRTMENFKGRLIIGTATITPDESCKVLEVIPVQ
jgi:hypothetical protein